MLIYKCKWGASHCPLIHDISFIHSFIQTVSHSFIQSVSQSFIHSFIQSVSQSVSHSFIHSHSHSFIHSVSQSVIHSFIHSFSQSVSHLFSQLVSQSVSQSFIHSFILLAAFHGKKNSRYDIRSVFFFTFHNHQEGQGPLRQLRLQPFFPFS